jgi:hypothetical protein
VRGSDAFRADRVLKPHLRRRIADSDDGNAGETRTPARPHHVFAIFAHAALGPCLTTRSDALRQILAEPDNPITPASGAYSTRVLLGRRDDDHLEVYARTLIELICRGGSSAGPLLLSISVREHSPEMFRGILKQIEDNKLW